MSFLDELVAEANRLIDDAEPELVPVTLARRQVGVRFVPMRGEDWQDLTLLHPPRPNVRRDLNVGYNIDAVIAAYPHVALVSGDKIDDMLRTDGEGKTFSKWPEVWTALTSTGRKDVASAIWDAHERAPERLVEEAGKA
ncbi:MULTISPECIES: hypothetical protein [unclassified Microbacterium]|uniref:hypothetical protein n=1 Tax=unclassified Microbacterium TaxID=2609290 RepID=UPI0034493006